MRIFSSFDSYELAIMTIGIESLSLLSYYVFCTGLYIVLHSPLPPVGGGEIIKGFGDGEKM